MGYGALSANTTGCRNTAIGYNAMQENTTCKFNTAVGFEALCSNNGWKNTAVGDSALGENTTGYGNVAMGHSTLQNNCGNYNVAMGGMNMWLAHSGCCNTASGAYTLVANISGSHNTGSGALAMKSLNKGHYNTSMGFGSLSATTTGCNNIGIGYGAGAANTTDSNKTWIGNADTTNTYICGALSKGSGTFLIAHPDPAKTETKDLVHSFVESPTEGDNLYRWAVDVVDNKSVIELPDYYRYLNKDDMVWTSPVCHFGNAYGTVTCDQKCLEVCANADGIYNVLLIGTRKDETAVRGWPGVEPDIGSGSPSRNLA